MHNIALLVDDDQHSLVFFEQILSPTGIQIVKAEDGNQAINLLNQFTPAIIFLDLLLPRVNGVDVLDYIQNAPHLNHSLVVIVSAQSPAYFGPAPQLERADRYLIKPVRPKEIRELTQMALARVG